MSKNKKVTHTGTKTLYEDIKVGNYYMELYGDDGKNNNLCKKVADRSDSYIDILSKRLYLNSHPGDAQLVTRACTREEILWLDECIKQGKYIPFEEVKINISYEIY